jgi:translation initiation factor 3 subunit H
VHTMTTMAAAVAASLPTVQAASTPVVPVQATLPASWNKRVDAEADIPITTVQIDGLVCLVGFVRELSR